MKKEGKISVVHHLIKSVSKKNSSPQFTINMRVMANQRTANFKSKIYETLGPITVTESSLLEKIKKQKELTLIEKKIEEYLNFEKEYITSILYSIDVLNNPYFEIKKVRNIKPYDATHSYFHLAHTICDNILFNLFKEKSLIELTNLFSWHNGRDLNNTIHYLTIMVNHLDSAIISGIYKDYKKIEFELLKELSEHNMQANYMNDLPNWISPEGYQYSLSLIGLLNSKYSNYLLSFIKDCEIPNISTLLKTLIARDINKYLRKTCSEKLISDPSLFNEISKRTYFQLLELDEQIDSYPYVND
ncbi:hypothetical protein N7E81_01475 [Reichenbachiella carrageenanivorans]|uniref:Uncharacterized protein n=1 Tax=Reichenbachiella carrageenanivorans TaxID=2979869 RepID=A0ABY6D0U2_9BACT|nr:hypothetical protein [Reichenbachiella carrageenanivorans]UXX79777.1 hypothetical protein N7E81_01475 [Reichenbachiella carrageenanivorans]